MSQLVEEAADALERRMFFEQLSAGYEQMRSDSGAWEQIEAERAVESGSLMDRSAE